MQAAQYSQSLLQTDLSWVSFGSERERRGPEPPVTRRPLNLLLPQDTVTSVP